MVGRHILRATAHVILRVAQGNPDASRRGRPLHQARGEVQRDQRRAIAHAHFAVGPPLDVDRPAQREIPHDPRLVPLVDDTVTFHVGAVTVRDRQQFALQEESRGLIRECHGRRFTRLEAGGRSDRRIDGHATRVRDLLRCRWRLVALDRKLMHCTHDVSVVSL